MRPARCARMVLCPKQKQKGLTPTAPSLGLALPGVVSRLRVFAAIPSWAVSVSPFDPGSVMSSPSAEDKPWLEGTGQVRSRQPLRSHRGTERSRSPPPYRPLVPRNEAPKVVTIPGFYRGGLPWQAPRVPSENKFWSSTSTALGSCGKIKGKNPDSHGQGPFGSNILNHVIQAR